MRYSAGGIIPASLRRVVSGSSAGRTRAIKDTATAVTIPSISITGR